MILDVQTLTRIFPSGSSHITVLDEVSFQVDQGESLSIMGPSGSGKTTLLSICAGLDQPSSGQVLLEGQNLAQLSERERSLIRNRKIGFVFQSFHLIPSLTALENVLVPWELAGKKGGDEKALELLQKVGLGERTHHYPSQMSGGEQQRVAIARAFINDPIILFADEPTGNLDENTSEAIVELLFQLNREQGTTLILVTHDRDLAGLTGKTLFLRGGKTESILENQTMEPA